MLAQLEIASPMDLAVIREELIAQGYVKNRAKQRKKLLLRNQNDFFLQTELKFSSEKQLQNDQLTLKQLVRVISGCIPKIFLALMSSFVRMILVRQP